MGENFLFDLSAIGEIFDAIIWPYLEHGSPSPYSRKDLGLFPPISLNYFANYLFIY